MAEKEKDIGCEFHELTKQAYLCESIDQCYRNHTAFYFSFDEIDHAYAFALHLNCRCVHPRGGVIQSVSSWKHGSGTQYVSSRQTQSWTAVTPQQTWASPAEVVDLTLDEDSRRKYLL